jgi:Tfp pilus assembly major pilin PilA
MKPRNRHSLIEIMVVVAIIAILVGIFVPIFMKLAKKNNAPAAQPVSTTGVKKATAKVKAQASGLTVEQENIKARLEKENLPGSVKHLYVLSAYSGQVLIYSTVKGKVTSSGKRLSPYAVASGSHGYGQSGHMQFGIPVNIGGQSLRTGEVLQDDGTYGHSIPYLFWFDSQGRYHQHYVSGGQILHISDQPLQVKSVVLNMELTGGE